MKGKLIKINGEYILNPSIVGTKLSIKNCEAISNGYDLDELADEHCNNLYYEGNINWDRYRIHFKKGFEKALEILSDNKFSEDDMRKAYEMGKQVIIRGYNITTDEYIKSLQQTEWEVEISEVLVGECDGNNDNGCFMDQCGQNCGCFKKELNLDKDGCLILKKL